MKRLAPAVRAGGLSLALTLAASWSDPRLGLAESDRRLPLSGALASRTRFDVLASCRARLRLAGHDSQVVWSQPSASGAVRCATEDLAWVSRAYLDAWVAQHRELAQSEARCALRSLLSLQRADGTWPASVSDGAPIPAFDARRDWVATAHAVQALGAGCRVLDADDELRGELRQALHLTAQRVRAYWQRAGHEPGTWSQVGMQRLPRWLPGQRTDVAAGLLQGLADCPDDDAQPAPRDVVRSLGDGLVACQAGTTADHPFEGFLLSAEDPAVEAPEGGGQIAALALSAERVGRSTFLSSAAHAADTWLPYAVAAAWSQASLATKVLARANLALDAAALHRVTGKERYATLAAMAASDLAQAPSEGAQGATMTPAEAAARSCAVLEAAATRSVTACSLKEEGRGPDPVALQAADGKAFRQDVARGTRVVGGVERSVAELSPGDSLWLPFVTLQPAGLRVDIEYWADIEPGLVLDVRLDGQAIVECTLPGAVRGVTSPTAAAPSALPEATAALASPACNRVATRSQAHLPGGPHTVAVRLGAQNVNRRLALTRILVQPTLVWRSWERADGHHIALLHSVSGMDEPFVLPAGDIKPDSLFCTAWDRVGERLTLAPAAVQPSGARFVVPAGSTAVLEW